MKVIAHRGWSRGKGENTIESFQRALHAGVAGVEFDIRLNAHGEVVVSHDPVPLVTKVMTLREALHFLAQTELELFIEFKHFTPKLFIEVKKLLEEFHLEHRTVLFGFRSVAKYFPWHEKRIFRLGIISKYPKDLVRDIEVYDPDVVLFGWVEDWQRVLFQFLWPFYSVKRLARKYPSKQFVGGVAQTEVDLNWLKSKKVLYASTADKPFLWR